MASRLTCEATARFYEWIQGMGAGRMPRSPGIWIWIWIWTWTCGDYHTGDLGPLADASGRIEIQIRDLDQTVMGNPAHDLVKFGLSLATAACGSALSGATTIAMIEALFTEHLKSVDDGDGSSPRRQDAITKPEVVRLVMREAVRRSWKQSTGQPQPPTAAARTAMHPQLVLIA